MLARIPSWRRRTTAAATVLLCAFVSQPTPAGTAGADANVNFRLYLLDGVEQGTANNADVEIFGASGFGATVNISSGTGQVVASQTESTIGNASLLAGFLVGDTGDQPYSGTPAGTPTVEQQYTVEADATLPGGTADGDYQFSVIVDVVNNNPFDVELQYLVHADVDGLAETDGAAGDSAAASSSITGSGAVPNLNGDHTLGCVALPGQDAYCETATPNAMTVTIPAFDSLFIDISGAFAASATATDAEPPVEPEAATEQVPLPWWSLVALFFAVSVAAKRRCGYR